MKTAIILIGPISTGKSTQAELLSQKLGLPRVSMDDVRWDYYAEIDYSEEKAAELRENGGFAGLYPYWKPFEIHAVERALSEHHNCVIDFGAGHSVYEDETLFARAEKALQPYANVILLLPSPNLDESVRILRTRNNEWDGRSGDFEVHAHFVKHPSNHRLAKHTVYTKDKSPDETCAEIIGLIRSR